MPRVAELPRLIVWPTGCAAIAAGRQTGCTTTSAFAVDAYHESSPAKRTCKPPVYVPGLSETVVEVVALPLASVTPLPARTPLRLKSTARLGSAEPLPVRCADSI